MNSSDFSWRTVMPTIGGLAPVLRSIYPPPAPRCHGVVFNAVAFGFCWGGTSTRPKRFLNTRWSASSAFDHSHWCVRRRLPSRNWTTLMQLHSSVGSCFRYSGQDVLCLMNRMHLLSPALIFSSSHWFFASILLIFRPSPMSQFLSQKLEHHPLSHCNEWKFSATKVLKKPGEGEVDCIGELNRPRLPQGYWPAPPVTFCCRERLTW